MLLVIGFNLLFLAGMIGLKIWADRRVKRNMLIYLEYLRESNAKKAKEAASRSKEPV